MTDTNDFIKNVAFDIIGVTLFGHYSIDHVCL